MVPPQTVGLILVIVAMVLFFGYQIYRGRPTVPVPSYKTGFEDMSGATGEAKPTKPKEGFFGGVAKGAGVPDCSRSSAEGAELMAMLMNRAPTSDLDVQDDVRELKQIIGKVSCFKKDLVSPSYIIDATKKQQFVTTHDIEPIAETTGRCFAKTISPRDLELAFDKWNVRGSELVRRICASLQLTDTEVQKANILLQSLLHDVKDIARGSCLQGEPIIAGKPGPRDAHPYEKPGSTAIGSYTGYY